MWRPHRGTWMLCRSYWWKTWKSTTEIRSVMSSLCKSWRTRHFTRVFTMLWCTHIDSWDCLMIVLPCCTVHIVTLRCSTITVQVWPSWITWYISYNKIKKVWPVYIPRLVILCILLHNMIKCKKIVSYDVICMQYFFIKGRIMSSFKNSS